MVCHSREHDSSACNYIYTRAPGRAVDEVCRPLLGVIGKCYRGKLKLFVELDCNIQIPTYKRIQHCAGKMTHSETAAQEVVSLSHGTHVKTEKLSTGLERWLSD